MNDGQRAPRALVVEDNASDRRLIDTALSAAGWDVRLAAHALDARLLLDAWDAMGMPPDVVLLDLALPDQDGLSFAEGLRGDPQFSDLRLVAMSSWASDEARRVSLAAGCDHFLSKPLNVRSLAATLARVCSSTPEPPIVS